MSNVIYELFLSHVFAAAGLNCVDDKTEVLASVLPGARSHFG